MIKINRLIGVFIFLMSSVCFAGAVDVIKAKALPNPELDRIKQEVRDRFPSVKQMLVAQFRATTLSEKTSIPLLLDVRESDEYSVSHLLGAKRSSSLRMALSILKGKPKNTPIVTYCSVGYRSSALAEKLSKRGFTNVVNLEGSIFEWANNGYPVFRAGTQVREVHIYNRKWGRLLEDKYHP